MRKVVSISLPEGLVEKLQKDLKVKNTTMSEFVRRLITQWFVDQEERTYLLKKRSNQILKDVIARTKDDEFSP